jgi:hypothetical protein
MGSSAAGRVLDRAASEPGCRGETDRLGSGGRHVAEAVLEVGAHR